MDRTLIACSRFSNISKSQYFFVLCDVGFFCFSGPWFGKLYFWRMQYSWNSSKLWSVLGNQFWSQFWWHLLVFFPFKVPKLGPKNRLQNWAHKFVPQVCPQLETFSTSLRPSRIKVAKLGNTRARKNNSALSREFTVLRDNWKGCWGILPVSILDKNCPTIRSSNGRCKILGQECKLSNQM